MCYLCSVDDGGVPVRLVGVDVDDALDNFLDDVPGQQGTTWTIYVQTTIDLTVRQRARLKRCLRN